MQVINRMDLFFVCLFALEAVVKILAFGFTGGQGYLASGWNKLDCVIACVGVVSALLDAYGTNASNQNTLNAIRAIRTLRALRPLRMLNRLPQMKVVVDSLLSAIPGIGNVLIITMLIYLIFGILGLNLFQGKLWYCEDQNGNLIDGSIAGFDFVNSVSWCNENSDPNFGSFGQHWVLCPGGVPTYFSGVDRISGSGADAGWVTSWNCSGGATDTAPWTSLSGLVETPNAPYRCLPADAATTFGASQMVESLCPPAVVSHRWRNRAAFNFDNIGWCILCLFEMASQESWTDVQYATSTVVAVGSQPVRNSNPWNMLFCLFYMVVGSFFLINLFVGVTIDKFNELKEQQDGRSLLMTEEQKAWTRVHALVLEAKSKTTVVRPQNGVRLVAHRIVVARWFERFILLNIVANTVIMALHSSSDSASDSVLLNLDAAFTCVYVAEAVLKLVANGGEAYFREAWNCFDFLVVVVSCTGAGLTYAAAGAGVADVLRTFRVLRVFRLIPNIKGLRSLFTTLVFSLPALLNVGSVLLLVYFMFAVLGMNLFGHLKQDGQCLERHFNFEDFPTAMLVLARMSTGENWNCIMHSTFVLQSCYRLTVPPQAVVASSGSSLNVSQLYPGCLPGSSACPAYPLTYGSSFFVDYNDPLVARWAASGWAAQYSDDQCAFLHSRGVAIVYFCLFMVVGSYVLINLVVAVIIDNFQVRAASILRPGPNLLGCCTQAVPRLPLTQASKETAETAVKPEQVAAFVEVWSALDPRGTNFIQARKLDWLLTHLDHPLGVRGRPSAGKEGAKAAVLRVVRHSGLLLHAGGYVHFVEVLNALSARAAYAQPLDEAQKARDLGALQRRMPDFAFALQNGRGRSAAHLLSALYVQSAVRGFLARRRPRRISGEQPEAGSTTRSASSVDKVLAPLKLLGSSLLGGGLAKNTSALLNLLRRGSSTPLPGGGAQEQSSVQSSVHLSSAEETPAARAEAPPKSSRAVAALRHFLFGSEAERPVDVGLPPELIHLVHDNDLLRLAMRLGQNKALRPNATGVQRVMRSPHQPLSPTR